MSYDYVKCYRVLVRSCFVVFERVWLAILFSTAKEAAQGKKKDKRKNRLV